MSSESQPTTAWPSIPQISCLAAVLSVLPGLWLLLVASPDGQGGPPAFLLSVSLAIVGLVLGVVALFVARSLAYSIAGILLSLLVLLFWGYLVLLAIASAIALP
jgi:hypothetical protein